MLPTLTHILGIPQYKTSTGKDIQSKPGYRPILSQLPILYRIDEGFARD